jgi:hypothetical protein
MKRLLYRSIVVCAILAFANVLIAGTLNKQGKEWLDAQKDAPAINVDGTWTSDAFGDIHLSQDAGSRDVSGVGGGYEIRGVVSGTRLYLLLASSHLASSHTVDYCAVLSTGSGNSMIGSYSSRATWLRFGAGLCQGSSRPMFIVRK